MGDPGDSRRNPFLPILIYVFGFLVILLLLALGAGWLLRRL